MGPTGRRRRGPEPVRLRVRMYQVGFGDCFLLSFEYAEPLVDGRSERHVLIDCGTTSLARSPRSLVPIARLIREHTSGQLDVVVVSHRHRDHLSGFGNDEIAAALSGPGFPRLVVRSWTEDPDIDEDATDGRRVSSASAGPIGPRSRRFLGTLRRADAFAGDLLSLVEAAPRGSLGAEVQQLAFGQIRNAAATEQLRVWSEATRASYLHYGMPSGIEEFVPGIGVRVLGPPTVDQHEGVQTMREDDPDEFWMLYRRTLEKLRPADLLGLRALRGAGDPAADTTLDDDLANLASTARLRASDAEQPPGRPIGPVGPVRWLTDRMGRQQLASLLRIVRILDDVLNNTSVILLFEVQSAEGPVRLLFPGDAQIEDWEYALKLADDKDANLDVLREVDLYKVGHHGSRNATPRTLFDLWNQPGTIDRKMIALLSTKCGVHGRSVPTAVPRKTLVAALDTRMDLYSTRALDAQAPWFELAADLTSGRTLVKEVGPDALPEPCPL